MEPAISKPTSSQSRRSCQTCASAKVKCTQSESGSGLKCDRCRRLNKECALQPIVDRRPRTRKKTTRVAQLEQKLDGLVNLLTSKENAPVNPYHSPESAHRPSTIGSPSGHLTNARFSEDVPPSPSLAYSQDPSSCFRSLSPAAAQKYLEIFQSKMSPYFPFVIIPPDTCVDNLRQEKPSLFSAVVVAASFDDIKEQRFFGEKLLRYFTEQLLIKGEKSLELLQALLVYMVWYHFVSHLKKRLTHLVSLAAALVTDLGLGRANPFNERLTITIDDTKGTYGCTTQGVRTLEERRAFTGVFYIASCVSSCYRELHTMKLSSYLEDCCTTLENAAEYPTDVYLVKLTRLQAMVERIGHTFQYGSRGSSLRQMWSVPLTMYIAPFNREFDQFLKDLPPDLQNNSILLLHYYSAKGYLYEIALYEPMQKTYYGQQSFRRMEVLFACLQAIKSFYQILDTVPTDIYYHIPMVTWTQVTHCLVNLSKLYFLDAEDWDTTQARQVLDFSSLLEKTCSNFEAASNLRIDTEEIMDETDMFVRYSRRMRAVKAKYDKRIAAENGSAAFQRPTDQTLLPQISDGDAMEMFANLDDEDFWHELMDGWAVAHQPLQSCLPALPTAREEPQLPRKAQTTTGARQEPEPKSSYTHATCSAAVN